MYPNIVLNPLKINIAVIKLVKDHFVNNTTTIFIEKKILLLGVFGKKAGANHLAKGHNYRARD